MIIKNKRVWLIMPVLALYWFSFYSYSPVLTEYVRSFSTTQMAGIVVASYGYAQMIIRIPVGVLSDKLRTRKWFVSGGLLLSMVSSVGMVLVQSPGLALVCRAVAGAGVSTWVPFSILFSSYYDPKQATRAMGVANAVNFGGQMAASLLGGFVSDAMGDARWAFYLSVGGAAVAFVMSLFMVDQPQETYGSGEMKLSDVGQVIRDKKVLLASVGMLMSLVGVFATVYGFTPTFAKENFGATQSQLGILTTLSTLPAVIASPLTERFGKMLRGRHNMLLLAFLLSAVYIVSVPFIRHIYVLYAMQTLYGFTRGLNTSLLMGYCIEDIHPKLRATAMGVHQAINGLGMALGPQIAGMFGHSAVGQANLAGLTVGFVVIAITTQVLAGFVCWYLMKRMNGQATRA